MKSMPLPAAILSLSFLFYSCTRSPVQTKSYFPVDLKVINQINNYKNQVDSDSDNYLSVKRIVDLSPEKGELTAIFSEAEEIKKITLTYYPEERKKYTEYVFKDNDYLLYIKENEYRYSSTFNTDSTNIIKITNEYYFKNNQLFYWLKNKVKVTPEVYGNKSVQIFNEIKRILQALTN